jgi:hypothetical protein
MTYNAKSAVKAAFVLCSFVAISGCEVPSKTKTVTTVAPCNCGDSAPVLRQAVEADDYVAPPSRRITKRVTATRRVSSSRAYAPRVSGSSYASSSYASSSYAQSEYYSSSYASSSSVSSSSSSGSYGSGHASGYASGYGAQGGSSSGTHLAPPPSRGWEDGYGKRYSNGQSYGGYYQDGGPGAAYIDVITDDRQRGRPWANYNFRTGLSNGY